MIGSSKVEHIKWVCTLGADKCEKCNYDTHDDLFLCTVCKAGEGELTTECPGKPVSFDMRDLSYNGAIDFIDGHWKTLRALTRQEDAVFNP